MIARSKRTFRQQYTAALKAYIRRPDESALHRAYKLGRVAANQGLGPLDMTDVYHCALQDTASSDVSVGVQTRLNKAYDFFAESFSSFEMLLRGYRETNAGLISLTETLRQEKASTEALLVAFRQTERIAKSFQQAALPATLPEVAGIRFDAYYKSASSESAFGGDWYDALRLTDGRIILSIGDVGYSGLSAAILMVTVRQVIRGVAYVHPDPVMILDAAGKALRAERPDLYVSALVGVIDPIEMTFTYSSAGHPPALLRHPDGKVEDLIDGGILLGVRVPGGFEEKRVDLSGGSTLVLYTDGLVEENRDIIAGEEKLHDLVAEHCYPSKSGAARTIYDAVFTQRARDDVAILVVDILTLPFFAPGKRRTNGVSRWTFDAADEKTAHRVRGEFTHALEAAGAHADDVFVAELVFGELLGNVVRYAPGPIEVFADWNGPAPVLHVCDQGAGFFYAPHLPKDPFAETGRGLFIVASMTDEYNVTPMAGQGSHARAVIAITNQPLTHLPRRSRRRGDSNESGTIGAAEASSEKMLIV